MGLSWSEFLYGNVSTLQVERPRAGYTGCQQVYGGRTDQLLRPIYIKADYSNIQKFTLATKLLVEYAGRLWKHMENKYHRKLNIGNIYVLFRINELKNKKKYRIIQYVFI